MGLGTFRGGSRLHSPGPGHPSRRGFANAATAKKKTTTTKSFRPKSFQLIFSGQKNCLKFFSDKNIVGRSFLGRFFVLRLFFSRINFQPYVVFIIVIVIVIVAWALAISAKPRVGVDEGGGSVHRSLSIPTWGQTHQCKYCVFFFFCDSPSSQCRC